MAADSGEREIEVLVVDIGGSSIKLASSIEAHNARFLSGPAFTPRDLVDGIAKATADWHFDAISIGMPAPIKANRLTLAPHNLGAGWLEFEFEKAFEKPVKVINDAAMQALGSYDGGKMLFLGLGTGLGAALVIERAVLALELAHLPFRDGLTFEDCVATRGLERFGRARWLELVDEAVQRLRAGMVADYVVLGGGHAAGMETLPANTRRGGNENAIAGGIRLWRGDFSIA